jgi:predicted nucleic acid-binding protein
MVIFDASAIVCLLLRDEGFEQVRDLLDLENQGENYVCSINYAEVIYVLMRRKNLSFKEVRTILSDLPLEVLHPTEEEVYKAAELKATGGISFPDCFGIILARKNKATLVVKDKEFNLFKNTVKLLQIA